MKIVTVVVVFVIMVFIGERSCGQNLVGNGSFEDTIACPDNLDQVNRAEGWLSVRLSPDYFNSCAPSGGFQSVSVPKNFWGFQYPASGNGYAGFAARYGPGSIRECIGIQLLSNLEIGTKYYISFKVSFFNKLHPLSCAVNKLGILFSIQQYSNSNPAPVCNCSQVYTDSIVSDTLNWTTIEKTFLADSNYSFISIGNFFVDSLTDSIQFQGTLCDAYYYIDDVCISTDSLTCFGNPLEVKILPSQSIYFLFPNPIQNLLTINFLSPSALASDETIAVYDVAGRKIVLPTTISNNKAELTTTTLPNGIYLLQIINNKTGVSEVSKFVKE